MRIGRRQSRLRAGIAFCALVAACLSAAGCASPEKKVAGIPKPLVGVLPLANQSVCLEAPEKVRLLLLNALKGRGYPLVEVEKIDMVLKDMGFSEGGQLGALNLDEFRAEIRADWFVFGTVEEFSFKSVVALSQREVALRLRVVDAQTGRDIFEASEKGITSRAGADAAGDLAIHMVGKLFKSVKEGTKKLVPGKTLKKTLDLTDEVADVDLTAETREAVRKLLDRLEKIPGRGPLD